jgi:hypothetical protein
MKFVGILASAALVVLTGCTTIGPDTVPRDRFDYNTAIADSWKEQTLLNIVKIRYADMPLFVEVASVVSGYSIESAINLGGDIVSGDSLLGDSLSLGASGKYTDRPTITYAPITGAKFNQSFMTPIPPKLLFSLLQSGWSAQNYFPLVLNVVNGLKNRIAAGEMAHTADPKFYRVIYLLDEIHESGHASLRVVKDGEKEVTLLMLSRDDISSETLEAIGELENLLKIAPGREEIKLTYGIVPETDREIAMQTRSMLQIMLALALQVVVPPDHVQSGRTIPTLLPPQDKEAQRDHIQIKNSIDRPKDAFVAVKYRDHWFWIDDRDFTSKRIFTFLMILFSLTESGGESGLPLVTISAD